MIEVYLFLAMFPVQILGMSVLYPILFARFVRTGLNKVPAERLAELYPEVDVVAAHERFLARYRAANAVVLVFGLVLLGWFVVYMQRPDWDAGAVGGIVSAYFMLQCFPTVLIAWFTTRFNKVHRHPAPEPKRKAVLERRGLFDLVSPLTVLFAILAYFQYAAVMFYVSRHPFPGFAGPFANIGILSLAYLLMGAAVVYVAYLRKKDPLQTRVDHLRMIRGVATYYTWMLILTSLLLSLQVARKTMDLETWGPFAGTVFFLLVTLLTLRTVTVRPNHTEADGLASQPMR